MESSFANYHSTYSSDMRSQMARSMDRETDLAKSYSVMSFVNREPVHPKSKEMATIRGGRITDTKKIQEIRDTFEEDHHEMLELRDYKDYLREKLESPELDLKPVFDLCEKFRRKIRNVKNALEEEVDDLDQRCQALGAENFGIRQRLI